MRLWSLHPKYLDSRGLVALWREGLLARAVLEGKTRGYKFHPQLKRFADQKDPIAAITAYLIPVLEEGLARGYRFDKEKLRCVYEVELIPVTEGQLLYEWKHLLSKLELRDHARFESLMMIEKPEVHPLMFVVPGDIEPWEKVKTHKTRSRGFLSPEDRVPHGGENRLQQR